MDVLHHYLSRIYSAISHESKLIREVQHRLKAHDTHVMPSVLDILLIQSIEGVLYNISQRKPRPTDNDVVKSVRTLFENGFGERLSFNSICKSLSKDPSEIKYIRQQHVEDVPEIIDKLLDNKTSDLIHWGNIPLYGVEFLENYKIDDPKSALKGFVLSGLMDSSSWRNKTVKHYGEKLNGESFHIGFGDELLIDRNIQSELNVKSNSLETEVFSEEEIDIFKEKGMIVDKQYGPQVESQYIRRSMGAGVCDDAALCSIGKIHGLDAMVMGFINDATDTYGKFIQNPVSGGMDQFHAEYVMNEWKNRYGEDLVTPEEIMQIIYLSAKRNSPDNLPDLYFSSSHRRFCTREYNTNVPTMVNHFNFVTNEEHNLDFKLGFDRFKASVFYPGLEKRWESYDEKFGSSISSNKVEKKPVFLQEW